MKNQTLSIMAGLLGGLLFAYDNADDQEELKVAEVHTQEEQNADDQYERGKVLLDKGDEVNAVKNLLQAAERGSVEAVNLLGECYMSGRGIERNETEGVKCFLRAAEQGNARAQANLGVCYLDGVGVKQDGELAILWSKRAAEQGLDKAMLNLALAYYRGVGVKRDEQESMRWFTRAAEKGDPEIQLRVALCMKQLGYNEQYSMWLEASVAGGCPDAIFEQATRYREGTEVEKNPQKAMELYQRAADLGYPPAQMLLGKMYALGQEVPRDVAKAEPYLRKALEEKVPEAAHIMGILYSIGELKSDNDEEVFKLYYIAAEYGGYVEDVYRVGICYLNGTGVAKDEHEGFLWLEQAAECDHPAAMYAVGQCYEYGKGVQKDQNKAQEWYKKAADNKNPN